MLKLLKSLIDTVKFARLSNILRPHEGRGPRKGFFEFDYLLLLVSTKISQKQSTATVSKKAPGEIKYPHAEIKSYFVFYLNVYNSSKFTEVFVELCNIVHFWWNFSNF